jgi:hypothetical protein
MANLCIDFGEGGVHSESHARRRWFVTLFYAIAGRVLPRLVFLKPKSDHGRMDRQRVHDSGHIAHDRAFSSISYDMRSPDEREIDRREHAYFNAYFLGKFVVAALLALL